MLAASLIRAQGIATILISSKVTSYQLCWPFGSSMHVMSVRGAPARRLSLR